MLSVPASLFAYCAAPNGLQLTSKICSLHSEGDRPLPLICKSPADYHSQTSKIGYRKHWQSTSDGKLSPENALCRASNGSVYSVASCPHCSKPNNKHTLSSCVPLPPPLPTSLPSNPFQPMTDLHKERHKSGRIMNARGSRCRASQGIHRVRKEAMTDFDDLTTNSRPEARAAPHQYTSQVPLRSPLYSDNHQLQALSQWRLGCRGWPPSLGIPQLPPLVRTFRAPTVES